MTGGVAVDIDGVDKFYGSGASTIRVLKDVSFHAARGEVVWLRGQSGAGKSSLLRIAGLLSEPSSGSVSILGKQVTSRKMATELRRRSIGIVFQSSNLLPDLTVVQNIALAAGCNSETRIVAQLEAFGLGGIAERSAKQISGGEAQRVALCRALTNAPAVLLADEPTSGLDQTNADIVRMGIKQASLEGCAVVIASHDAHSESVCDRTIEMKDGRIVS
ncbi:MAG: ABC transporter ATP-binding protein [Actinomycetales bacterium]|nr:MAG: ABC transporter ATP-binding protein [Actinomycetales bacterium]